MKPRGARQAADDAPQRRTRVAARLLLALAALLAGLLLLEGAVSPLTGRSLRGLAAPWPVPLALRPRRDGARGRRGGAIDSLPARQRTGLCLLDLEGVSAVDVWNILEMADTNQRVLLHRARSALPRALERYLDEGQTNC